MALENVAEDYFSNLNPIAARLSADLKEVKGAYEDLWKHMPEEEKQQILTDSIIKPEVLIQYCSKELKRKDEYAVKIVLDDQCSYRDEHSGPFSFRTQSQRNLTIFQTEKAQSDNVIKQRVNTNQQKACYPKPLPKNNITLEMDEDKITVEVNSFLPKTGLDFLDNW